MVTKAMLNAYLEAAVWSSTSDEIADGSAPGSFTEQARARAVADIEKFIAIPGVNEALDNDNLVFRTEWSFAEQAGHDLWLTRNGHGCGFWDGDWKEPAATLLTAAAKSLGECFVVATVGGLDLV